QGFNDKPVRKCEKCGGRLKRLISVSAFHLKGSGWYETDYGKKKISEPKQLKDHDIGEYAPDASSQSTVLPTEQAAVSGSSQTYDSIKSDTKKAKSKQKKK
ncbi:MAG: hypothetical protein OXH71_02870, partial [Candidatus Dadabacteria bacterium]|nr:hypothetical protein [Candidatus Dadabacteria bacterium]